MVGADKYGMLHMEWKKASSFFLVITPYMTPFLVYHQHDTPAYQNCNHQMCTTNLATKFLTALAY